MADAVLERAFAKRDAALREAAEWETFIQRYRQLVEGDDLPMQGDTPGRQARGVRSSDRELPLDSELSKTITAVEEVLNDRGCPMPLGKLFDEVMRRGLNIGGANPRGNFGARLFNSGRFRSINKKDGWWFKDQPIPTDLQRKASELQRAEKSGDTSPDPFNLAAE